MTPRFVFVLLLCLVIVLLASGDEAPADSKRPQRPRRRCCSRCPAGWTRFRSRCYYYNRSPKKWKDGELDCRAKGGNLASIHSLSENNFVRNYMNRVSNGHRLTWIGLHDAVEEGCWLWTDGSKFNYVRWGNNEPNNLNDEDCVEINWQGDKWNDRDCTHKRPYICSRDLPCCHHK